MNFLWGSKPYKPESTYTFENQPNAETKGTNEQTTPKFSSAFSSLFSSVVEKVKTVVVEEKKNIQQFLKDEKQESSTNSKNENNEKKTKAIPPWLDFTLPDKKVEEEVRNQIMNLTKSKRNFTNAPPEDANFSFDYDKFVEIAQVSLEADPNLANARFYLVPKFIREPKFWRNYFYRVYIIKEAYGLNKKDQVTPLSSLNNNSSPIQSVSPSSEILSQNTNTENEQKITQKEPDTIVVQSKDDEFVSDHLMEGNISLGQIGVETEWEDEINRELEEKLKASSPNMEINDAWEEELKKELENQNP